MALTYFEFGPCTMPRHIVEIHKYIINTNSNSMYIYNMYNIMKPSRTIVANVFQCFSG